MTSGALAAPPRPGLPAAGALRVVLASLAPLLLASFALTGTACQRSSGAMPPSPQSAPEPAASPLSPPDRFELDLARGEYVHLTVEQGGVDRTVTWFGPDGALLLSADSLGGTLEEIHWVARAAGVYRLEVEPAAGPGAAGVEVAARRPAAAEDRRRAEAEATLARAHHLRRTHDPESCRRAAEVYRDADRLFAGLELATRRVETLFGLGLVLRHDLGRRAAARRAFETAAALAADPTARSDALHQAGELAAELGDPEAAAALYEAALELRREGSDREGEARTANNLGNVYHRLGRYDAAAHLLERAAELWRQLGLDAERANTLANLGRLELELGEPERARGRFEEALALARRSGDAQTAAAARSALGIALLGLGQLEDARGQLEAALAGRPAGSRGRAVTLTALGVVHRHLGDVAAARAAYREALALFRRLGDTGEEARALHNLGFLALSAGDGPRALELLDQALARFAGVPDPMGQAQTRLVRAKVLRAGGDLPAAREEVLRALGEIEDQRLRPRRSATRAAFFATHQDFYDFVIDLLMEMHLQDPATGWDAEALEIAERARARSLLDTLAAGGDDPRGGSGSVLLEEEQRLEARIEAARDRWEHLRGGETASPGEIRASDAELEEALEPLRRRLDEVRSAIRAESPRWAALTQPRPSSVEQIQAQLDGETLLLEIRLGPVRGFLWALTPDDFESFILPAGRQELETAVRRVHRFLRGSYSRKREIPARRQLEDLAELLLAPVADRLTGRRLVVVADGALQYLPFAALPLPGDGAPVAARHEVVSLPSASALVELRRRVARRPPAPHWLWALADPAFGGRFQPLPHSREEAQALAALAPPGEAQLALGVRASRQAVLGGALSRFRLLHFATHGIFEAGSSRGSRLILAQVDAEGFPVEDGLLRLADVYRLELAADLVVLSACETALGEEIRGEGLVGMTQGFLHAGAERVVVSLWNVPDRVTAELMKRFYRGLLLEGLSPAAALREAQEAIRRQPTWASAYYWAGFLLQGEWRGLRTAMD